MPAMRRAWLFCWVALSCNDPYGGSAAAVPSAAPSAPTTPPDKPHASPPSATSNVADEDPKAGNLHYVEIVVGDAKADDELPMIVAIHGLGDQPRNFAHLFDNFTERARVILPRGIDPTQGGGWSWFPFRARDPDVDALGKGIGAAADEIATTIAVLQREKKTLGKPIVTGFSQGGMLSFAIAVRHPDLVAAALPIGGWLPPPLQPTTPAPKGAPPVRAFHGTDDNAVKYEPTRLGVEALKQHGWDAQLHTYEGVGHVITPEIHRDLDDALIDALRSVRKKKN